MAKKSSNYYGKGNRAFRNQAGKWHKYYSLTIAGDTRRALIDCLAYARTCREFHLVDSAAAWLEMAHSFNQQAKVYSVLPQ